MPAPSSTVELRRAFTALRTLFADPDDLPQVFTIIEAFGNRSLPRMERRMNGSESGHRLLENEPNIVPLLEDRDALRRLPEGSLGRAYLAFVESENISPAGLLAADREEHGQSSDRPRSQRYLRQRLRDTHDLWHALTGYKGDVLGEAALLGFTLAQSWNTGIAMIVGLGLLKTSGKPEARQLILDGYRRGRRATWLPALPWETLLGQPVEELRRQLHVAAPPVYTPVRSAELKLARAA